MPSLQNLPVSVVSSLRYCCVMRSQGHLSVGDFVQRNRRVAEYGVGIKWGLVLVLGFVFHESFSIAQSPSSPNQAPVEKGATCSLRNQRRRAEFIQHRKC